MSRQSDSYTTLDGWTHQTALLTINQEHINRWLKEDKTK